MTKSLAESAAEILSASLGANKEPMKKGAPDAQDLGGETPTQTPDAFGAKAAAAAKEAPKPGTKGDAKSVKTQAMEETETEAEGEEVELTEEELEEYLNSLSEEELAELAAEAEALEEEGMTGVTLPLNKGVKAPLKKGATLANPKMAEETEETAETTEEVAEEPALSEEEVAAARKAALKEMVAKNMGSCKEDVDALFNGEALSEEFRGKATTIFEAAVRARVEAIAENIAKEHEEILASTVEEMQEALSTQVDEYLSYVVENWMEENQLAVETGLRAEIAEDFMSGLKNLFAEHYIEVPEEKADLVEEMAARVTEAEEKLAEQVSKLAEVTKALHESKSQEILRKICEGLTEVQIQKIKALAEGVEFTTEGDYTEKLSVIRENYFPSGKAKAAAPQVVVETEEPKEVGSVMDHYVKAITKQLPK